MNNLVCVLWVVHKLLYFVMMFPKCEEHFRHVDSAAMLLNIGKSTGKDLADLHIKSTGIS